MSLKVITCYALECDWCAIAAFPTGKASSSAGTRWTASTRNYRISTSGGASPMDGRHCCTDCLTVTGDDRYVTPDGTAATLLNGIHITERT